MHSSFVKINLLLSFTLVIHLNIINIFVKYYHIYIYIIVNTFILNLQYIIFFSFLLITGESVCSGIEVEIENNNNFSHGKLFHYSLTTITTDFHLPTKLNLKLKNKNN